MKIQVINHDYYVKPKVRVGGKIRTNVFEDGGIYNAYSSYWQDIDEEVTGFAQSTDEREAIRLSRKDLREGWREHENKVAETNKPMIPTIIIYKDDKPVYVVKGTLPPEMTREQYYETYGCYPLEGAWLHDKNHPINNRF